MMKKSLVNFLADEFQANNDAIVYNEGVVNGKSIKLLRVAAFFVRCKNL